MSSGGPVTLEISHSNNSKALVPFSPAPFSQSGPSNEYLPPRNYPSPFSQKKDFPRVYEKGFPRLNKINKPARNLKHQGFALRTLQPSHPVKSHREKEYNSDKI
jgi:hypothetical protein